MITIPWSFTTTLTAFLEQPKFAVRTRESYAQDLLPLAALLAEQPISALTEEVVTQFLERQQQLAPNTYNRRVAALKSLVGFARTNAGFNHEPLRHVERRPSIQHAPRALDPLQVEAKLRAMSDVRDRALFWFIYDTGLRCREALAINIEDITWSERSTLIQGKGRSIREAFFSKHVSRLLDTYLKQRGSPTLGPLFVTHRKARAPRRTDVDGDGYARLSYRQADTRWKAYTGDWDLHQLRHTAISARAANGFTEVELKRFSGHRSLRSLEVYIAENREAAKRKARAYEREQDER